MWRFEHTVETGAPREAVWRLWEDVPGWKERDEGLDWARLDGPFATGTRGVLKPRGVVGAIHVRLAPPFELEEVVPHESFTLAQRIPLGRMRTHHQLEETDAGLRRVTQRVEISGPLAPLFARLIGRSLAGGLPRSMRRLANIAEGAAPTGRESKGAAPR